MAQVLLQQLSTNHHHHKSLSYTLIVFLHIFEWLSLHELLVFRRTCKRIKAVCDFYIKLHYNESKHLIVTQRERWLEFCNVPLNSFECIEHIIFGHIKCSLTEIDSVKYVLNKLESITLYYVQFDGDFYEDVLKHCPCLKCVAIASHGDDKQIMGDSNEWLLRQYPKL